MTEMSTHAPAELRSRPRHADGAYFEIATEPYLHPLAYTDFSTVDYGDSRLAA